jgi:hypothetical protein
MMTMIMTTAMGHDVKRSTVRRGQQERVGERGGCQGVKRVKVHHTHSHSHTLSHTLTLTLTHTHTHTHTMTAS